ncbi:unnamed protein product [Moneuplotes crassus]|uniref:Anaphase-promoting complex subunit 10 n=1 Tax=Euplotes crassus TaxID=5936 RepID=A0AAD2D405_EUPCR|nr:unnamed protein product [Moneuplotes crassus]CAI2379161.1 unnamed protein product [Moneuplotes crassus]
MIDSSNVIRSPQSDKRKPDNNKEMREIGDQAVWTLSSAKQGHGVDELRDNNTDTFWQSDCAQPHFINIEFQKKMKIKAISIFIDFKTDESYTPSKVAIKVGNSFFDLQEVKFIEFFEPYGWYTFDLDQVNQSGEKIASYIKTMCVQIEIRENQHNGRDTHIRQVKVFSPRVSTLSGCELLPEFETVACSQFSSLR